MEKKSEDNTSFYLSISSMICIFILIIVGGILLYIYYIKDENKEIPLEVNKEIVIDQTENNQIIEENEIYGENISNKLPFELEDNDIVSLINPGQNNYLSLCNNCFSSPIKAMSSQIPNVTATSDSPTHAQFLIKYLPNGKVNLLNQFEYPTRKNYLTICNNTDCPLDTSKIDTWVYFEKDSPKGERSEFKLVENGYDKINIIANNEMLLGRCDNCVYNNRSGIFKSGISDKLIAANININDKDKDIATWTITRKNLREAERIELEKQEEEEKVREEELKKEYSEELLKEYMLSKS